MKTSVLAFAVAVMMTGLFFLGTPSAKAQMVPDDYVKALVIKAVQYPEQAIKEHLEGVVVVSFKRTAEGKIEVLGINSVEPLLKDYVYQTLTNLQVPPACGETETVYLRFTFKLL